MSKRGPPGSGTRTYSNGWRGFCLPWCSRPMRARRWRIWFGRSLLRGIPPQRPLADWHVGARRCSNHCRCGSFLPRCRVRPVVREPRAVVRQHGASPSLVAFPLRGHPLNSAHEVAASKPNPLGATHRLAVRSRWVGYRVHSIADRADAPRTPS
jgi:hypothetical protein